MKSWNDRSFQVPSDTKWQARLRALQSWYREEFLRVAPGRDAKGTIRGNFLPVDAPPGLNFLTSDIARFVDAWAGSNRQSDSLVDEDRLRRNMLSSMPLAFNLFVPLHEDLTLASVVFAQLTQGRVHRVTSLQWEYSPGRGDPRYTTDRTAFDVFVEFETPSAEPGFIGIEVKYHESLRKDRAEPSHRYREIAAAMGCFRTDMLRTLADPPLGQLWRNHLLAGSLGKIGGFSDTLSVLVYPNPNPACLKAANLYRECLTDSSSFAFWNMERVVQAAASAGSGSWAREFITRYLDLAPLGQAVG